MISLIAAMGRNRVIGRNNTLPWRLPADMRHFRRVTMGKPVLMGRKTFESLGKPLAGRANIIITHDPAYRAPGCRVVHSVAEALAAAGAGTEIMVLGGADIFAQFLPHAARMYLTYVHGDFDGDAFFPAFDAGAWVETERTEHAADAENPHACSFVTLERA
ncbi:MAG: type 3 dihydrofolate reductase [Gammaproteobacteria bacterium]|nr:type 3 dihydrofolate reductase [Gammaproteobacteria bacterium]